MPNAGSGTGLYAVSENMTKVTVAEHNSTYANRLIHPPSNQVGAVPVLQRFFFCSRLAASVAVAAGPPCSFLDSLGDCGDNSSRAPLSVVVSLVLACHTLQNSGASRLYLFPSFQALPSSYPPPPRALPSLKDDHGRLGD